MAEATGLKSIADGRSDMLRIDPRKLKIREGWNNRDFSDPDNAAHVQMLKASIKEIGVKEPLRVVWEDKQAFVTNGECRLRACMLAIEEGAEIKTVPVITEERYANEADRLFTQIASNSGKPFSPLEMAITFKKLIGFGWKQTDIALKSGFTNGRVSQILGLLALPDNVQQMIKEGKVSASMALDTLKESNFSGTKAEETLKTGMQNAANEGSAKVQPRHLNKQSAGEKKSRLKQIFEGCDIDIQEAAGLALVKMTLEEFEELKVMLKLELE